MAARQLVPVITEFLIGAMPRVAQPVRTPKSVLTLSSDAAPYIQRRMRWLCDIITPIGDDRPTFNRPTSLNIAGMNTSTTADQRYGAGETLATIGVSTGVVYGDRITSKEWVGIGRPYRPTATRRPSDEAGSQ